ncbi:MAG TPA: hypothetical protein VL463_05545 [Kofleriaceae bacterium]|nr:hypothetical protein [Kofleriaceae bacterium]
MKRIKLPKPTQIKLELVKETIRSIPDQDLHGIAGGGTHKQCSVPPWCPAHTC